MKHWENKLSALLLITSGMVLLVMLVQFIWIDPPGSGVVLIEPESSAESVAEELSMPEPPGPVHLNQATLEELISLPGVGETLARRILEYRQEHGRFSTLEELMEVRGIGEKNFAKMKEDLVLD